MMAKNESVAVVGCGLIGRAWAIAFARSGYEVRVYDPNPAAAQAAIAFAETVLPDLEKNDLLNGGSPAQVVARLRTVPTLKAALDGAIYLQESASENIEIKRKLFAEIDEAAAPETILASSTSAILPSKFTEHVKGRHRCIVVHPINPPYLVPAVEVVPAPWTDPKVVERTREFIVAVGQSPIMMKREIDGFVMNRLQGALLQEAFRLVAEGYASAEDVDIGIRDGLGLRWAFIGPYETIDLNAPGGARDYVERYEGLYKNLWQTQQHIVPWGGETIDRIEEDRTARLPRTELAERTRWRDRRLMALVAHKRQAAKDIGK
jgi:3-hydroxyacyl-CoA dehydrogenase